MYYIYTYIYTYIIDERNDYVLFISIDANFLLEEDC